MLKNYVNHSRRAMVKRYLFLLSIMNISILTATQQSSSPLTQLAYDYLQFIHDVGSARSVQQDDIRLVTLFAPNLTKIDNRSVLFKNDRALLLPQMRNFEKEYNPTSNKADWVVHSDTALIIPSTETNTVVIHFEWTHIHVGKGTTTVILQCNTNGQIERITDVWAKVQ